MVYQVNTLNMESIGTDPISVEEAKLFCRVENDLEDGLFATFINAAMKQAEHFTGRVIRQVRFTQMVDVVFNNPKIYLPVSPLVAVESIKFNDETIDLNDCEIDLSAPFGIPLFGSVTLPCNVIGKVTLQVLAGYDPVPEGFKQWILTKVATLYEYRESAVVGQNFNVFGRTFVDALIEPYSVYGAF